MVTYLEVEILTPMVHKNMAKYKTDVLVVLMVSRIMYPTKLTTADIDMWYPRSQK